MLTNQHLTARPDARDSASTPLRIGPPAVQRARVQPASLWSVLGPTAFSSRVENCTAYTREAVRVFRDSGNPERNGYIDTRPYSGVGDLTLVSGLVALAVLPKFRFLQLLESIHDVCRRPIVDGLPSAVDRV